MRNVLLAVAVLSDNDIIVHIYIWLCPPAPLRSAKRFPLSLCSSSSPCSSGGEGNVWTSAKESPADPLTAAYGTVPSSHTTVGDRQRDLYCSHQQYSTVSIHRRKSVTIRRNKYSYYIYIILSINKKILSSGNLQAWNGSVSACMINTLQDISNAIINATDVIDDLFQIFIYYLFVYFRWKSSNSGHCM